jgi:hypothetical protein
MFKILRAVMMWAILHVCFTAPSTAQTSATPELEDSIRRSLPSLTIGERTNGFLKADIGPPSAEYWFELRKGEHVSIRIVADFTPFVRVTPLSQRGNWIVSSNFDGWGTNPAIIFEAPEDGTYLIHIEGRKDLMGKSFTLLSAKNGSPPAPHSSARWLRLVDSDSSYNWLLDTQSVRNSGGGIIEIWTVRIFARRQTIASVVFDQLFEQTELDCRARRYRFLHMVANLGDDAVHSSEGARRWVPFIPGSNAEVAFSEACSIALRIL